MRICIVGDSEDLSAAYITWLAQQRGAEVHVLREDRSGLDWWFSLGTEGEGSLQIGELRFDLAEIDGAFVRLHPEPGIPDELELPEEVQPVYALERRHGLHWLLDNAPFHVVNRPSSGRGNGSKPYQMAQLEAAGFRVPAWIVTSDAERTEDFVRSSPAGAVYKSCSGLRSHVRRVDAQLLERLRAGTTPVVVQAYIAGVDVRVHTVGRRVYATEVGSESVDYRFDPVTTQYRPTEVPAEIAELCVKVAAGDGLVLSGFDFRRSPDGTWWCLEMNPVPTFLPYEASSAHPIGDAVLDHLLPGAALDRARSPLTSLPGFAVDRRESGPPVT